MPGALVVCASTASADAHLFLNCKFEDEKSCTLHCADVLLAMTRYEQDNYEPNEERKPSKQIAVGSNALPHPLKALPTFHPLNGTVVTKCRYRH